MLELFYWPTPNGKKVAILLEELGTPYTIRPINIGRGDQFAPDFLKMSPNNRMPALKDNAPTQGGAPITVFESGAIMMYLAEKYGQFLPEDMRSKYDVVQWVMWQMGNQGPKFGERGHFLFAAQKPENGDLHYATNRFTNEVHRLYGVMNLGLHKKDWLAADQYTIADMICYPWASAYDRFDIDLDEFPNVKRWLETVKARPAVEKAMALGADLREDPSNLSEDEAARRAKVLANQRARPIPKEWG